jgi:hypothetical protein
MAPGSRLAGLIPAVLADSLMMKFMVDLVLRLSRKQTPVIAGLTENIFNQADTWEDLRTNVIEATAAFFFDQPRPERIRLHLVRDEVLSIA